MRGRAGEAASAPFPISPGGALRAEVDVAVLAPPL